jgi:hypothetical protein
MAPIRTFLHQEGYIQVGGVSSGSYDVGERFEGEDGRRYVWAKMIPGAGSVTGARHRLCVPYETSDVHVHGEFTFDLTDSNLSMVTGAGICLGSMMTAVTHYCLVQTHGQVPYALPSTTLNAQTSGITNGMDLHVSTTDKVLVKRIATTTSLRVGPVGWAMENFTSTASATKNIMLLGQYH